MAAVETRTVLVTDMEGSTAFRVEHGDAQADRARRGHAAIVEEAVASHEGTVVKGTGDGVLAVFSGASNAVAAAISIQQRSIAERADDLRPAVRVGLAAGDVTLEHDDCFGRPVIEACRLEALADADGILATKLVELLAAGRSEAVFSDRDSARLKGFPDLVPIAEVTFDVPRADVETSDVPVPITATRLAAPGLPLQLVTRPRVQRRLERSLTHRIALVEAGAGYGKSVAAAAQLVSLNSSWCWVSCDRNMTQPVALMAHLCAAIAKAYPGFGLDSWPDEPGALAAEFTAQTARTVAEALTICLDDVHLLADDVLAALMAAIDDSPKTICWLLLSREPVPLFSRSSLDAAAPLVDEDLAFDGQEAAELVELLAPGTDVALAHRIHNEVEGWAAGLVLGAREADRGGKRADASFDYLAQEALGSLPPELVDALERLSLPSRFEETLAAAATGQDDSRALLAELARRNLFTISLDDGAGWFRFHHLFRAYLRSRLDERDDLDLAELHGRLARAWVTVDEPEEAVRSFLEAGDSEGAARTLGRIFPDSIGGPRYLELRPLLESIPPPARRRNPTLLVAEASAQFFDGQHELAYADYERSIELLLGSGDRGSAAGVLIRYLQSTLAGGIALDRRISVAERLLPAVEDTGSAGAAAMALAAVGYGHATATDDAERLIDRALDAGDWASVRALASPIRAYCVDFPRGDIDLALARLDTATREHPPGPDDAYAGRMMAMGLRSAVLPQVGRYEDALAQVEECIAEADRSWGSHASLARAIRWWQLSAAVGMGDWAAAAGFSGDPSAILGDSSNLWSHRLAAPHARLAASRGDVVLTKRLIRHGAGVIDTKLPSMDAPMILCELAHAAADTGLEDTRRDLAGRALAYSIDHGLAYREAFASIHCAACASGSERDEYLERALALTADRGYEFLWTQHAKEFAAPLLARGLELDTWRSTAAGVVALAGRDVSRACARALDPRSDGVVALREALLRSPDPDPEAISIVTGGTINAPEVAEVIAQRPRAPLWISTYGGLSVERAGQPLDDNALPVGSGEADILARLVAAWPDATPIADLVRLRWPDLEGGLASAEFETALTRLRIALDPWMHQRRESPVVTSADSVRLRLDSRDVLDIASLRDPASWATLDLAHLERVERATVGDFLPDHADAGWRLEAAEALAETRTEFLLLLAERLRAAGQPFAAAERLNRLVEADPEREELHRRLMRCYVDGGETARALRQFHACRTLLLARRSMEPSAETRALYDALV